MKKYDFSWEPSRWYDRRADPVPCYKVTIKTPFTAESHPTRAKACEAVQRDLYSLLMCDITPQSDKITADRVFKRRQDEFFNYFDFQYSYKGGVWVFSFKSLKEPETAAIEKYLSQF